MRVLLVVPSLAREFGGPVDKALGLRAALLADGVQTRLVGAGAGDGEGLPVFAAIRGTPIPRAFGSLRRAARAADVVHVLGYRDPVGMVAAASAARAHVPFVLEPCGMYRPRLRSLHAKRAFDRTMGRAVVDRAAIVIATSELERRELVEDGVAQRRIRTRRNGLNIDTRDLPARGTIRQRYGVPPEAPLVLALGRLARKKGLIDLAHAVMAIPAVHVLIAGPDARDGTLARLRRAADISDGRMHVDAMGLWNGDKLAALADADCFALPSMTENFGNAAAEAAASGVPVVVSSECGVAEVLDTIAHRVVSPGAIDELTSAIVDVLKPQMYRAAKQSAKDIRLTLDWSMLAREQRAIYEGVLAR